MRSLRNRVIVITGASSGIGRAAALAFASRGSNVVLAARRIEWLEEIRVEVERMGAKALVVPTDVTAPGHVQRLIDASVEHFGQIDVLVNNAGAGLMGSFVETPMEEVRRLFDLDFLAAADVMQAGLKVMERQERGVIINVSSAAGLLPTPYMPIYNSAKAALVMLSESVNAEYLGTQIRIVAFCPAMTRTEFGTATRRMGRYRIWVRPGGAASAEWVAEKLVSTALHPKPLVTVGRVPILPASLVKLLLPRLYYFGIRWYRDQMQRANPPEE